MELEHHKEVGHCSPGEEYVEMSEYWSPDEEDSSEEEESQSEEEMSEYGEEIQRLGSPIITYDDDIVTSISGAEGGLPCPVCDQVFHNPPLLHQHQVEHRHWGCA